MSKEGFCNNKCSSKQITVILKSLKRKGDVELPSRKKDMIQAYEKMKNREPMTFDYTDINKMSFFTQLWINILQQVIGIFLFKFLILIPHVLIYFPKQDIILSQLFF